MSLHATVEVLQGVSRSGDAPEPEPVLRGHGKLITLVDFPQALSSWKSRYLTPSSGRPHDDDYIRGLYLASDLTPYIHALCAHLPGMLAMCVKEGLSLGWFSASAQEKKNHLQVHFFFDKTFKGGLRKAEAEKATMEAEGRRILFIRAHAKELKSNGFDFEALIKSPKGTRVFVKN